MPFGELPFEIFPGGVPPIPPEEDQKLQPLPEGSKNLESALGQERGKLEKKHHRGSTDFR